ncbi:MotA/TolQ/ExbB proton channel family protein [Tropicimonas marinistellae]|uniref:MotA/TolQ/ExbB proton channel family protein n=1 Tax=Tropicimonas marinistellae TaxID=1739787 RepID=UPI000AF136C4|nr:MotA/TolQ/ExbB proton channel family protein [Tropicimonas marinistellae]
MADEQLELAPAPVTEVPSLPGAGTTELTGDAPMGSADGVALPGVDEPTAIGAAQTNPDAADPGVTASPRIDASTSDTATPADTPLAEDGTILPDPAIDAAPTSAVDSAAVPEISDPLPSAKDLLSAASDPELLLDHATALSGPAVKFLQDGGPTIWAIAALSIVTVALILWKVWRLALIGAWSRGKARQAVEAFEAGNAVGAKAVVAGRRGLRSKCIHAALHAREVFSESAAREDATRFAKRELAQASTGLRPLELIATIAPLLGLLGTVLGMIAAFQALQEAGAKADPATLAGGIWEALLTTAAGMAVAIPASAALAWFEGLIDRMAADVEDGVTRIFVTDHQRPKPAAMAAE